MNIAAVDRLPPSVSLPIGLGTSCLILALWPLFRRSARPLNQDVFFGVTVAPDWPDSVDGRAVSTAYLRRVTAVTALAFGLSLVCAVPQIRALTWATGIVASPILQVIGATAAYLAGWRAARPHAVSIGTVREASLDLDPSPAMHGWILNQIGPVALLAASAMFLYWRWPVIPARFPTHFNAVGQADHWGSKSIGAVFTPVVDGLLTCAFIFTTGAVTIDSGRRLRTAGRSDQYLSTVLQLLLMAQYTGALIMGAVALSPAAAATRWSKLPMFVTFATLPVMAIFIAYFALRRWPTIRASMRPGQTGDGTPDGCWRWGLVYANRADPAVLVPKRFGFGYTLNFGRGGTWVLICVTVVYLAAIVALPLLTGRR